MKLKTLALASCAFVALTAGAQAAEEIYFINCGGGDDEFVPSQSEHIAAWEAANPDYTVNVEFIPWGQCQEKSLTLAAAGNPPGIAYMGSRVLKQLAAGEMIRPFDLTDEEAGTYSEAVLNTVRFDGNVWGIPRAFSTKALFWNKDLFAEAGVDMPDGPQTFEDVLTAAKAISESTEAKGYGLPAASFDNTMHHFLNWMYSNGGAVLDADGKVVFDSPEVIETLQFFKDLTPYVQNGPIAYDRGKVEPLFAESQVAMMVNGGWGRFRVGDVNYGISPIPAGPSGDHSTLLITDSLVVFAGSGVEDAAADLVKTLTSVENQEVIDKTGGWTPIRLTAMAEELVAEDPTWEYFISAIPTGGPEPLMLEYVAMQDVINEAIQGVILGEIEPEEAAASAAEELRDLNGE
ncbi:ABC transporter substrate-binding protein [Tropicimonas marinistellae]|uniref:ABC transporter substrate-binding protein n=1 Tax=Tropicimonas marinistellae TaxID=1739787 RepID=UPI00082F31CF|nr:sugar ABC transporter substrate-binding protein [Tropicimonas marinistellae]